MRTPTYKQAINWIAENDEPTITDPSAMIDLISVVMVADLFDVAVEIVAQEIVRRRAA